MKFVHRQNFIPTPTPPAFQTISSPLRSLFLLVLSFPVYFGIVFFLLRSIGFTARMLQITSSLFNLKKRTEFAKGKIQNVDRLPWRNVYKTKTRTRIYDTERDWFCMELREISFRGLRILIRWILQTCSDELIAMNRRLNACYRLDDAR